MTEPSEDELYTERRREGYVLVSSDTLRQLVNLVNFLEGQLPDTPENKLLRDTTDRLLGCLRLDMQERR